MAFTGVASVVELGPNTVLIVGSLTLAAGATGTIGLDGDSGADVQLPKSFDSVPIDKRVPAAAAGFSLLQVCRVTVDVGPNESTTNDIRIQITSTRIEITNRDADQDTGLLRIYVTFPHSYAA